LSDVLIHNFIYDTKNIDDLCITLENTFINKTPYNFKSFDYNTYLNSWLEILN
jgi:hypothetical protein